MYYEFVYDKLDLFFKLILLNCWGKLYLYEDEWLCIFGC